MKTCDDMTRDVLDRVHAYQNIQKKRRAALRTGASAAAVCLVLAVGVAALWRFRPVGVAEGAATASSVLPKGGEYVYGSDSSRPVELIFGSELFFIDNANIAQTRFITNESYTLVLGRADSEEKEIIDFYYRELCEKFPDYARIPPENLWVNFGRSSQDGSFTVSYAFRLPGGLGVQCAREFHSAESEWRCADTGFSAYFETGMPQEQLDDIRADLVSQIQKRLAKDHLQILEKSLEDRIKTAGVAWTQRDGKLYAEFHVTAYPADKGPAVENYVYLTAQVELGSATEEKTFFKVPGTPPRAEWVREVMQPASSVAEPEPESDPEPISSHSVSSEPLPLDP